MNTNRPSRKRMRITVEEQRTLHERLKIIGMHCASCAITIEKKLRQLPGIKRVSVSLAGEEAVVEFDASSVSLRDIVRAIREVGYDAYREEAVFLASNLATSDDEILVETRLSKTRGVVEVRASHTTRRVYVAYNPVSTSVEEIRGVLEGMGYRVERVEHGEEGVEDVESKIVLHEIKKLRQQLTVSAVLSAILLSYMVLGGIGFSVPFWSYRNIVGFALSTPVLVFGGSRFFRGAYRAFRNLSANMDTLVSLGAGSAYVYSLATTLGLVESTSVYYDATSMIITFILLGRYLEARMKLRTSDAVRRLASLQPKTARVIRGGAEVEVPIPDVRVGDIVVVKQGERIPVDGVVEEGSGYVDESLVTGESMPVHKKPRSPVIAGSLLVSGYLKIVATRVGSQTVLAQMARLVRQAQASKPPIQRLVDRVAGVFSWLVIGIAVLTFMYWYLVAGLPLEKSLVFMASVLLVSCPCALGLATPIVVVVGVGRLAEMGVIARNAEALEKAAKADVVVFDKTGTLTHGKPRVVAVEAFKGYIVEDVIRLAATAEKRSEHPIARAIVENAKKHGVEPLEPEFFESIPGQGVVAGVNGKVVGVGNERLVEGLGASLEGSVKSIVDKYRERGATVVYVVYDGKLVGVVAVADEPRETAKKAVSVLKAMGLHVVMLTGDNESTARAIAKRLGIDEVYAEVAPEDKADKVRELQRKGHIVVMVGDGINDAPSLVQADVGIAMGGGTDIAREAGDFILVSNNLLSVPSIIEASRVIKKKIKFNLFWAFIYNVALIPVAAGAFYSYGLALRPELAALAMAFSSVSVTMNALRLRRWRPRIVAREG
jgi:Cu2+-exporting ATPase/Cu+-exporting ATPase